MSVDTTHPEYDASLPAWQRARDVLAGEDAVKTAGEKYLPRLDSQSDEEYASYRKRAAFFNATARTLEEYLDLVFRRAPVIALGELKALAIFAADCDLWGTDMVRYARRVVSEVLSVGRGGTLMLCDPPPPGDFGAASSGPARPWVRFWQAEDILTWEVEHVGERVVLSSVALRDGERVRVLRLQAGNPTNQTSLTDRTDPTCVMEVWKLADSQAEDGKSQMADGKGEVGGQSPIDEGQAGAGTGGGREERDGGDSQSPIADGQPQERNEWELVSSEVLVREGKPLSFIPFVFHGPRHSRSDPDRLPLADIIAANLDHYRLDADYKHGLHFTALPTAWVSGFDKAAPLRIGSSSAWVSEVPGASAGFLEFSGRGLAHLERAIEKIERRMATSVAADIKAPGGGGAGDSPAEGQLCGLGSIVASLNQSLSRVLQLAQWWVEGGEVASATATSFAMNTDLGAGAMSGEEITAVVAAWRAGAISRDTMLERLKRGEVLPDGRSVARERELIHGQSRK